MDEAGRTRAALLLTSHSGFFPGLLWLMANHTGNTTYADWAQARVARLLRRLTRSQLWTAGRAVEAHDNTTHDVGFMVFYSFGKGLLLGASGGLVAPLTAQIRR